MNILSKVDLKKIRKTVDQNLPSILVACGIGAMVAGGVSAVKKTPEALDAIEEARRDKAFKEPDEEFTKKDAVKASWKFYIGPIVMTVGGIAMVVASNRISNKRLTATASMLAVSQETLRDFHEATKELVGEKKAEEIDSAVAEKKLPEVDIPDTSLLEGSGTTLCLDELTGRVFLSDMDRLERICTRLNKRLIEDLWISVNDLYDELDIRHCVFGEMAGWDIEQGLIEFRYSTVIAPNNKPCLVLRYSVRSKYNYIN